MWTVPYDTLSGDFGSWLIDKANCHDDQVTVAV